MSEIKWYYFKAEGGHYGTNKQFYFTAKYEEQARAKARILCGYHHPLLDEKLIELNEENNIPHKAAIERLMKSGKDDFDRYITKHEEGIFEMIQILEKYI